MKKSIFILAALLATVLAGCAKEENVADETPAMQTITLSCNIADDPATRATFSVPATGSIQPTWEEGDAITVVATDFYVYKFTMVGGSISADSKTASFTGEIPSNESAYYALYPWFDGLISGSSSFMDDYVNASKTAINNQTYTENAFDKNAFLLMGSASDSSVNLGAGSTTFILHLKGTATIGKITITGNTSACLNCGSGVALDASTSKIFAITTPVTFSTGDALTFKFYDTSDNPLAVKTRYIQYGENEHAGILEMPELTIKPAGPTTGTAKAKLTAGSDVETDVTWIQLWPGGPKWATINVGVTSTSATGTDLYGGLYRWGGTNEMRADTSLGDDHNTGSAVLSGDADTATKLWGSNWRMPTRAEFMGLMNYCTWSSFSGGYTIAGEATGFTSNSIFLPAAGHFDHRDNYIYAVGSVGDYWSSTPDGSSAPYELHLHSSTPAVANDYREYGMSVRAVLNEN